MDIEKLTIGEAREIARLFAAAPADEHPWEVGENYLIRTVTMIDAGKLIRITNQELVLENASWIADTGRFADALEKLDFNEVEPFPAGYVIIGRGSVIDAVKINSVPRCQV